MTKDLTTGKIMPILVNFTVPLVLGNLFQLTYNAVDSIINNLLFSFTARFGYEPLFYVADTCDTN